MSIQSIGSQNYQNYDDIVKKSNPPKITDESKEKKQSEEKLTLSTDDVDSEIEDLKSKRLKLKQTIQTSDDEALQQQLKQVENELRLKDNDEYRKQHAKVISGLDIKI